MEEKEDDHQNQLPKPDPNAGPAIYSDDPWIEAERLLAQDPQTKPLLDQAQVILQSHGLNIKGDTSNDRQNLSAFIHKTTQELEDKKLVSRDGRKVRDKVATVFRNILMLKDVIESAAAASPPASIACAAVTVSFTVSANYTFLQYVPLTHIALRPSR